LSHRKDSPPNQGHQDPLPIYYPLPGDLYYGFPSAAWDGYDPTPPINAKVAPPSREYLNEFARHGVSLIHYPSADWAEIMTWTPEQQSLYREVEAIKRRHSFRIVRDFDSYWRIENASSR
jgi:hypothetical protein